MSMTYALRNYAPSVIVGSWAKAPRGATLPVGDSSSGVC